MNINQKKNLSLKRKVSFSPLSLMVYSSFTYVLLVTSTHNAIANEIAHTELASKQTLIEKQDSVESQILIEQPDLDVYIVNDLPNTQAFKKDALDKELSNESLDKEDLDKEDLDKEDLDKEDLDKEKKWLIIPNATHNFENVEAQLESAETELNNLFNEADSVSVDAEKKSDQLPTDESSHNESIVNIADSKKIATNNTTLMGSVFTKKVIVYTVDIENKGSESNSIKNDNINDNDIKNDITKNMVADVRKQPYQNIKAAIEDIYVDALSNFPKSLPLLLKTAEEAAKSVGYYDVKVRFAKEDNNQILVFMDSIGEPVIVDSRFVDVRGAGSNDDVFQNLEKKLQPLEGNVFHHGQFASSKSLVEYKANQMGYFDGEWLNKSADIILPDNTAEVALVYDTGNRYEFDNVVFFTIDEETGKATTNPEKLPIERKLLYQLLGFKQGDNYDALQVNKLNNNLAMTKYFNNVSIETVLPSTQITSTDTNIIDTEDDESSNTDELLNQLQENLGEIEVDEFKNLAKGNIAQIEKVVDVAIIALPNLKIQEIDEANISNHGETNYLLEQFTETDITDNIDAQLNTLNEDLNNQLRTQVEQIRVDIDDSTTEKFQTIENKALALLKMPDNQALNQDMEVERSTLAKISHGISSLVKKVIPDDTGFDASVKTPILDNKITATEVQNSKRVPLYVMVMSNKPYDAQIGIGYGTDIGFRTTSKLDNNLLNKQGYQAGVSAEVSAVEKKLGIYASKPWSHPLNDTLNGGVSYEEHSITQENNDTWQTKSLLATLARNRHSDTNWNRNYSLKYRYDELDLGTTYLENISGLPVKFNSSDPQQQALLLGYSMTKTTSDSATNPSFGYKQHYGIELGANGIGSDTNIAIAKMGLAGLYSFGEQNKHQVIGKVNTAYLWSDDFYKVPYKLRFFAGGDQTIKGYDYNSLSPSSKGYLTGGQILAVANTEYSYEFKEGLRGAIFADIGNAYDKDFNEPTKIGMGLGIRWASPVGQVRVDVGAGVTENSIPVRLHLFIGSPL